MGKRLDFMLFPGGKNRAMTFSYDDGVVQDRRLVELFNRYHVKGTFNLNTAPWVSRQRRTLEASTWTSPK